MTEKTKDTIVNVGTLVLTVGTSCLVETIAGYGTVALLNHVIGDNWTRAQVRFFTGMTVTGMVGMGLLTANKVYPEYMGMMQDLMDIFPTDPKEVNKDG